MPAAGHPQLTACHSESGPALLAEALAPILPNPLAGISMKSRETPPSEHSGATVPDDRSASDALAKATEAIAQLAALQRKRRQQAAQPQTVEDVVRELMRPMLENWLDRAVPKLVENVLRPELRRALEE
jgi:uncharacterized protein